MSVPVPDHEGAVTPQEFREPAEEFLRLVSLRDVLVAQHGFLLAAVLELLSELFQFRDEADVFVPVSEDVLVEVVPLPLRDISGDSPQERSEVGAALLALLHCLCVEGEEK